MENTQQEGLAPIKTFQCNSCKQILPLDTKHFQFFWDSGVKRTRYLYRCKTCTRRKLRTNFKTRVARLFHAARNRSRKKGLEFELDIEWISVRLKKGTCELSGANFELLSKNKQLSPRAPTIDRIVPELGYTKENSRMICRALNAFFGSWGEAGAIEIALAYLSKRGIKI